MLGICICQKHVKEKKGVTDSEICSYRWNKEKNVYKKNQFLNEKNIKTYKGQHFLQVAPERCLHCLQKHNENI